MSKQQRVFGPYWTGAVWRFADPLELWRALQRETNGNLQKIVKDARNDDDLIAFPALDHLMPAARKALGMVPFDPVTGTGATEADVHGALNAFWEYLDAKKKAVDTPPTSLPPSAPLS